MTVTQPSFTGPAVAAPLSCHAEPLSAPLTAWNASAGGGGGAGSRLAPMSAATAEGLVDGASGTMGSASTTCAGGVGVQAAGASARQSQARRFMAALRPPSRGAR